MGSVRLRNLMGNAGIFGEADDACTGTNGGNVQVAQADEIEGVSDRALQDAGGWNDPKTPPRYRRNKQRNAQNVVQLRQRSRTGEERS